MKGKNSSYNVKAIEFIVNIFEILAKEATLLLSQNSYSYLSVTICYYNVICYFLANMKNLVNQCNFLISNPFHLQITCYIGTERDL